MEFGQCWHKFDDVRCDVVAIIIIIIYGVGLAGLSDPKENESHKVNHGNKEYWIAGEVASWY